jgi:prepilin-type processing-associated H-X9-DG protein
LRCSPARRLVCLAFASSTSVSFPPSLGFAPMNKSAFTLTELLVIIAIVATVVCLALPAGVRLGEKSRGTQELGNLRQLGIANQAYLNDHNNQFLSSAVPGGWPYVIHSKYGDYLTEDGKEVLDWKVFKSPYDKRPDGGASSTGAGVPVSYGINVNILTRSAGGGSAFDGDASKLTSPSQLILMAPNVDLTQSLLVFLPGTGDSNVTLNVPTKAPVASSDNRGTHANRSQISVLFADGHVAGLAYGDFAAASSANDGARARWRPIHNP